MGGARHNLAGRVRVAREGFNGTCTGPHGNPGIRGCCKELLSHYPDPFSDTEFKVHNLEPAKAWKDFQVISCEEVVGYGMGGDLAPPLSKSGTHLEPAECHKKMEEKDTVI